MSPDAMARFDAPCVKVPAKVRLVLRLVAALPENVQVAMLPRLNPLFRAWLPPVSDSVPVPLSAPASLEPVPLRVSVLAPSPRVVPAACDSAPL
jgi:hypothetical protein